MFAKSAIYLLGALSGLGLSIAATVPRADDSAQIDKNTIVISMQQGCCLVEANPYCAQQGNFTLQPVPGQPIQIFSHFDGNDVTSDKVKPGCVINANVTLGTFYEFKDDTFNGQSCGPPPANITVTNPYRQFGAQ